MTWSVWRGSPSGFGAQTGGVVNVPAGGYTTAAVNFNATNYMVGTANTPYTGAVDGQAGMVSFWFKMQGNDGSFQLFLDSNPATGAGLAIQRNTANKWYLTGLNAAGTPAIVLTSNNTFTAGGGWHHLLASWDADPGTNRGQLYIDDVSDLTAPSVDGSIIIDYNTATTHTIGSRSGTLPTLADIEDLWISYTTSLDISNSVNRRLFISAGLKPVDLGASGTNPGSSPIGYFSGRAGVASWHVNKGTGGNLFTVSGTLSAATTNPSD